MLLALKSRETSVGVVEKDIVGFLIKEENIQKFLEYCGGTWTLKSITEWEPREMKTKKEKENEPKEAVPLSRWNEAHSNDSF